ncbi:hypothetical protein DPEC_G00154250 [Dallia pectoralis]|uniref:Uncharacterized protein n=1 Tax=Dallia pectoralis TaxID=75939 RepID=A0ACC2GKK3_DALPE|nr:hypothetical protein DPEC_G00154250 [Dallia pectoralis]
MDGFDRKPAQARDLPLRPTGTGLKVIFGHTPAAHPSHSPLLAVRKQSALTSYLFSDPGRSLDRRWEENNGRKLGEEREGFLEDSVNARDYTVERHTFCEWID